MFDTELLRSFAAVAENGGFTRAAGVLKSTQSTVSAQIQRLENEAGRPLFVRSTRAVRLTRAGETLLGYARTILRLNEDARLRLSGVRHAGRLRIGAGEDLAESWLPNVLRYFSRQCPNVGIELEIGIGTSLFKMLENQEVDLVVGGLCTAPIQGRSLWKERLVWAFSADAKVPNVLPVAFFPEPCPYREAALRALASTKRQWQIACTSPSLAGVRAAAMAGLAVTPLPRHTIRSGLRILGEKDSLPTLPEVEYVLRTSETETREAVAAFSGYCEKFASGVESANSHRPIRAKSKQRVAS
jgi:DNA-binding transcriptional LysR family regulator